MVISEPYPKKFGKQNYTTIEAVCIIGGEKREIPVTYLLNGKVKTCRVCYLQRVREEAKIGSKFGQWEVVSEPFVKEKSGHRTAAYVTCKCECGKVTNITIYELKKGDRTCCLKCASRKQIKNNVSIGDTFDKWEVVGNAFVLHDGKQNRSFVRCRCKCGREENIKISALTNGYTKQCTDCARVQTGLKNRKGSLATNGRKICSICKEELFIAEFTQNIASLDKLDSSCKKCNYYRSIRYKYGLTKDQYIELYDKQNGCCAFCGEPFDDTKGRRLDVDHCHDTNMVRGLCHGNCNRAFGMLRESSLILRRGLEYAEKWQKIKQERLSQNHPSSDSTTTSMPSKTNSDSQPTNHATKCITSSSSQESNWQNSRQTNVEKEPICSGDMPSISNAVLDGNLPA